MINNKMDTTHNNTHIERAPNILKKAAIKIKEISIDMLNYIKNKYFINLKNFFISNKKIYFLNKKDIFNMANIYFRNNSNEYNKYNNYNNKLLIHYRRL